ncbi:MAG: S-layer homology domain-containing protein [Eubacteriales bacterium]|nr:S-layer homology domain-containing protein [Eubacteriales bacterium]
MNVLKRAVILALVIALAMAMYVPGEALVVGVSFSDVPDGAWYEDYLEKCTWLEIINGMGDGTFQPNGTLTRGQFVKMLAIASELYTIKNDTSVSWAAPYWNMLNEAGVLDWEESAGMDSNGNVAVNIRPIFPCTKESLNAPITRYEMAYLINGVLYSVFSENLVELRNPEKNILDYTSMPTAYKPAVAQAYGKGVLTGYTDTSFQGDRYLTRAEATSVLCRLLWGSDRRAVSFAEEIVPTFTPTDSFAFRYRNMSTEERRLALFGDVNKTYFTSTADAGNHLTGVEIRTWDIAADGSKYTRTWMLYVNVVVAEEVAAIFEEIYNDPEQFPIHSIGGARFSDTLRHSWGCAIDINPVENYYIHYASGSQVGTCCWENVSQYPWIDSRYCITPNGSVVRAFAKYGWGWGGQGWSTAADYMHFSILASGG